MAKVKDQLAQLGMGTLVAGMKTVESTLSKKQYKRLIATAVAQLLTMHPDYGAAKARRRARKIVGAKPSKKLLVKAGKVGVKETLGTAAAAAASGAALKVASKVGRKLTERVSEAVGAGVSSGTASRRDDYNPARTDEDAER
ncbi:MAG TPA: hypothetical protein VFZ90_09245 [Gemmatimonadales bacterium]|jgi:hypothetical protein